MTTRTPTTESGAPPKLTGKQRVFVERYLTHWNASRAAREAKYSEKTAATIGYENLRKPEIQAAIEARLAGLTLSANEVLARLTQQARGTMEDLLYIGEEEITLNSYIINEPIPDADLEPGEMEAISSDRIPRRNRTAYRIETVRRPVARIDLRQAAERGVLHLVKKYNLTAQGVAVELYSAQEALGLLAKHHGLLGDDGVLKHIDLAKLNDDQLTRLANGDDPLQVLLNT